MEKAFGCTDHQEQGFKLNETSGYFQNNGVDVMAFDDIYPDFEFGYKVTVKGEGTSVLVTVDLDT